MIDSQKRILETEFDYPDKGVYFIHTKQTNLSTINKDSDNYANNYDHFTYDRKTEFSIVRGAPCRLNVVERAGGYKNYKEKVSDHIPIMLEIDLK